MNPRRICVGVTRRARSGLPEAIELVRLPPATAAVEYDGVRCQPVADAILACRGRVRLENLLAATADARRNGYVTETEARRLRRILRSGSETVATRLGRG